MAKAAQSLVIVESPSKAKTISKYLGAGYTVEATVGHVRDLPKSKLGVDVENNYECEYVTIKGKGEVLKKLRAKAKDATSVYLATDPDREGEAIAWHIVKEVFGNDGKGKTFRVLFHEITPRGIAEAMKHPLKINDKLVDSQQARRVMDRILGYKVSPYLWKRVYYGLSAGRVQSVALRLICEREEEIQAFAATEYWSIVGEFSHTSSESFFAKLFKIHKKEIIVPEKDYLNELRKKGTLHQYTWIENESAAIELMNDIRQHHFSVSDIQKKISKRNPSPPFITSTMQQEAASKLRFSAKKTMMVAQQLYEGIELGEEGTVGLITYMRTDSTRLSEDIVSELREYIFRTYGKEYIPEEPLAYKKKKSSQDAHEAIRPTMLKHSPKAIKKFLTPQQYSLYELIWSRFVACQMSPATLETTTALIEGGPYLFKATASQYVFRGFLQAYDDAEEEIITDEDSELVKKKIPLSLQVYQNVFVEQLIPHQHFTKPPARYSESTLVKELESLGIGRPSTYASIVSTVQERGYVEQRERRLFPTSLGIDVNKILVHNFPDIFNVQFTATMEEELETIATGKQKYKKVLDDFYVPFVRSLEQAEQREHALPHEHQTEAAGQLCEKCGKPMIERWGRNGKFLACSGYPECKSTKPLKREVEEIAKPTGVVCEKCGSEMVFKLSKFGKFLGCSNYPECKNIKPITLGIKCPTCSEGDVLERKSKRGKAFYGCSRYPDCDFVSWDKPVNMPCDVCNNKFIVKKYSQKRGEYFQCPNCKAEISKEVQEIAVN
ncbi:MAG: type I DNA topoisomerase [Ignavibacteria bacterium]|nr:type I DNA topoisomerase [Ignavibacteria bacterium]